MSLLASAPELLPAPAVAAQTAAAEAPAAVSPQPAPAVTGGLGIRTTAPSAGASVSGRWAPADLDAAFDGTRRRSFWEAAAAAALVVPASSSFHELGHYLAARAIGRSARIRVNKVLISDLDSASYPKRLLVSAAGPGFNFVLSGASASAALTWAASPWTAAALWLYAGLNLVFGATNLLPFRGWGVVGESGVSDGRHILDDWRAWRAARRLSGAPTRAALIKDDRRSQAPTETAAPSLDERLEGLASSDEDKAAISAFTRDTEALSGRYAAMTPSELRAVTGRLRLRRRLGASLDSLLPEAFAAGREAMARALGKRPFVEQVMAAAALHMGRAVEQKTGEGKTLSIGLAAYLNSLDGPVDVHTFNPYLAVRDAAEIGRPLALLGVPVGALDGRDEAYMFSGRSDAPRHPDEKDLVRVSRRELYRGAAVVYGHTNAFVFDRLFDQDAPTRARTVRESRPRRYAIVDEADAAMMEEAASDFRIVSRETLAETDYAFLYALTGEWKRGREFELDEKERTAALTPRGRTLLAALAAANPDSTGVRHLELYARNALKARHLLTLDRDYSVVKDSIVILDPHTGRLLHGRYWEDGLHRFVEIKEGLTPGGDSRLSSHMTLDAYFRGYRKTAGVTGTLSGSEAEFASAYGLATARVPPHRPSVRVDRPPLLFPTRSAKLSAVVAAAVAARRSGRPVLIGTKDVAESAIAAKLLAAAGEPFELLNGLQSDEAGVVARAGRAGALTVATQIAGRGTDVKLTREARAAGGLLVLIATMSESERVDLQYRGRAGRQGDPGETRLFTCLEDDLLTRRATDAERAELSDAAQNGTEAPPAAVEILRRVQARAEAEDSAERTLQREKDLRLAPLRDRYFSRRALGRSLPLPGAGLYLSALHRGWGDFLADHEDAWRLSSSGPSSDSAARSYARLVARPALAALLPHRVLAAATRGARDCVAEYFSESHYARAAGWIGTKTLTPIAFFLLRRTADLLMKMRLDRPALPILSAALELRPADWRARDARARALYQLRRYDDAAAEYKVLLESFWGKSQQFDEGQRRLIAAAISNLALSLEARSRGRTGVARALDLALAGDLAPEPARKRELEDLWPTLSEEERAVASDRPPFMRIVYLDKARTMVDRGNFSAAKYYYDHVVRMAPSMATAYIGRAWAEHQLKDSPAAGRDFGEALRLRLLDSRQFANMRLAYSLAAGSSLDAARLEEAFSAFWSAEKPAQSESAPGAKDIESAAHSWREGRRRLDAGDPRGAISWLDSALRRNPRDGRAYDDRGVARFRLGDNRGAYEDFVDSLLWDILDSDGRWNHLIVGHEGRAQWTPAPGSIAALSRALKGLLPSDR